MNDPVGITFAGLFGLALGSFANVVIYRLPLGKSVVSPGSRCPQCNTPVAWYDNVPVLGYLLLRGRCRCCRSHLSIRYPVVELLFGATASLIVWGFGASLQALWMFLFVSVMIIVTFIDWDHQIIPDELSVGGMVLGWLGALIALDITVLESFVGSVVGGGVVLLIAVAYKALRKEDGMGGGDVKLMAMVGAFLGWKMVFPVIFIAAFVGSVYGVYLMRRGGDGKTAVAFGSFLAPAACLIMFLGERLWSLYLTAVTP